ncbi:MAG: KorA protein [Rhodocyclales bacterium]|nr:KorA protein [Rhodocyclales bacterium]
MTAFLIICRRRESMNIEEFTQQVQPRKKRSKLIPFIQQIRELKARGYTDQQIRQWLAMNQIEVSREAVRKFIKNQVVDSPSEVAHQPREDQPQADAIGSTAPGNESNTDRLRKQVQQQQEEAASNLFRHDKTGKHI